jgi:4-hydroxybenzoate polyprenyltransferase
MEFILGHGLFGIMMVVGIVSLAVLIYFDIILNNPDKDKDPEQAKKYFRYTMILTVILAIVLLFSGYQHYVLHKN